VGNQELTTDVLSHGVWTMMALNVSKGLRVSLALLLAIAATAIFVGFRRGQEFTAGRDGVRIGSEFVPYAAIEELRASENKLLVVRRDGTTSMHHVVIDLELAPAFNQLVQQAVEAPDAGGEHRARQTLQARDFRQQVVSAITGIRVILCA
jgi:hypothetical protein